MFRYLLLIAAIALSACASPEISRQTELPPEPRPAYTQRDLGCLSEAIYFEAGNRGEEGRRAVAHVIMNRVASDEFPDSVCDVVAHGQDRDRCQFIYRCDLDYTRFIYPGQKTMARNSAKAVLSKKSDDPTKGALFFHADWAAPSRFFKTRMAIGNYGGNVFYL